MEEEEIQLNKLYNQDCIEFLQECPPNTFSKVITSPPYNIGRNYRGYRDNLSSDKFLDFQIRFFKEIDRPLKKDGIILLNFSYGASHPTLPFSLVHRIDRETEFTLLDTIIWKKANAVPTNHSNRLTRIVEYIFVIVRKSEVRSVGPNKKEEGGYKYFQNIIEAANNDGLDVDNNDSTFSTELVLKLMNMYVNHNDILYEPYNGLGTSIRGALIYGIQWVATELDWSQSNYFNNKRLPALLHRIGRLKEHYSILGIEFNELDKEYYRSVNDNRETFDAAN